MMQVVIDQIILRSDCGPRDMRTQVPRSIMVKEVSGRSSKALSRQGWKTGAPSVTNAVACNLCRPKQHNRQ